MIKPIRTPLYLKTVLTQTHNRYNYHVLYLHTMKGMYPLLLNKDHMGIHTHIRYMHSYIYTYIHTYTLQYFYILVHYYYKWYVYKVSITYRSVGWSSHGTASKPQLDRCHIASIHLQDEGWSR